MRENFMTPSKSPANVSAATGCTMTSLRPGIWTFKAEPFVATVQVTPSSALLYFPAKAGKSEGEGAQECTRCIKNGLSVSLSVTRIFCGCWRASGRNSK
jgi:hypothetical protein